MDEYVIFKEFGKRRLTSKQNYDAVIQNASRIIDVNNFSSDESVRDYLIREWHLLPSQIIIVE